MLTSVYMYANHYASIHVRDLYVMHTLQATAKYKSRAMACKHMCQQVVRSCVWLLPGVMHKANAY